MPKISFITASYNYENFIKETIESVINQTVEDWELLVVDDGSEDNSVEVINSYCCKDSRIKLYQHENGGNKGLAATLKLGIEFAQGEWIVFLESDDTIEPNYLEEKLSIITKNPDVNFIFNDVNMFGDEDVIKEYEIYFKKQKNILNEKTFPADLLKYFTKINVVSTFSAVMLHKKTLIDLDYNVAFDPLLDLYLWAQIAQKYKFFYIDKKLTNWRMHKTSYIFTEKSPIKELNFKRQMNNIIYYHNIIKKIYKNFIAYRKYFFRIRNDKFCFNGKWYNIGIKK